VPESIPIKDFRANITIDHGHEGVHEQDRVHHAFRKAAKEANKHNEQGNSGAEDDHAPVGHRRTDPIGCHIESAQQEAAAQQVEERAGVEDRIDQPKDAAKERHPGQDGEWDAPVGDTDGDQKDTANQQRDGRCLTQRAADIAEEQVDQRGVAPFQEFKGERGSPGEAIHCEIGNRPGGHRHRKRGLHKSSPDQRRVEDVVAQPAKDLLAQSNGDDCPDGDSEKRDVGRQDQRQQQACDRGTAVQQVDRFFAQGQHAGLRGIGKNDRYCHHQKLEGTIEYDSRNEGREQGQGYHPHYPAGCPARVQVGG
jgi:hypothetical protein